MITLKGAEVSAKIKEQVLSMNQELNGYVPIKNTCRSCSIPSPTGSGSARMTSPTREMS